MEDCSQCKKLKKVLLAVRQELVSKNEDTLIRIDGMCFDAIDPNEWVYMDESERGE